MIFPSIFRGTTPLANLLVLRNMQLSQIPTTTQERRIFSSLQNVKMNTNQTQENNHREKIPSDGRSFLGNGVIQTVTSWY
jgi:hypothetical protein